MYRTALALASLLAMAGPAPASGPALPDGPTSPAPDLRDAPGPVGSGPGDVAEAPLPFPFPGYRPDLARPQVRAVPAPSVVDPDGKSSPTPAAPPGSAEIGVAGPAGDVGLALRMVRGGNEEPATGPGGTTSPDAGDDRHRLDEYMRQAVGTRAVALPPGSRRDVPAGGYDAVVAKTPPLVASATPGPGDPCRFTRGGSVEVLGRDPELGTLVRYASGSRSDPTACADGVLAFVPDDTVSAWPAGGDVLARARAFGVRAAAAADRILSGTDRDH